MASCWLRVSAPTRRFQERYAIVNGIIHHMLPKYMETLQGALIERKERFKTIDAAKILADNIEEKDSSHYLAIYDVVTPGSRRAGSPTLSRFCSRQLPRT